MNTVMRHLLLLYLLLALVAGCRTTEHAQADARASHDTAYVNSLRYDSIIVSHDRLVDRSLATVLIQDRVVEYRYRLLRDTVRTIRMDTIPVIRETEITKEVSYIPWWAKALSAIGLLTIVLFLARLQKP